MVAPPTFHVAVIEKRGVGCLHQSIIRAALRTAVSRKATFSSKRIILAASPRYEQMVMLCPSIEEMNTMYPQANKSRHAAVVSGSAWHARDRPFEATARSPQGDDVVAFVFSSDYSSHEQATAAAGR